MSLCGCTDLLPGKEDYVEGPHFITIQPGTVSGDVCTDIEDFIIDDEILESTEDFTIQIEGVSPCGSIGTDNTTVVSITDNDSELLAHAFVVLVCQLMCYSQDSRLVSQMM